MRPALLIAAAAALLAAFLAGCGEPDQAKTGDTTNRSDVAPWQGARNPHVVQGWNPGNQGSWENQIRARGQLQNEYVKTN